jgi:hypothetical protein
MSRGKGDASKPAGGRRLPWLIAMALVGLAALFRIQGEAATLHATWTDIPVEAAGRASPTSATGKGAMARQEPGLRRRGPVQDNRLDEYLHPGDDFNAVEERLADRVETDDRALFVMLQASLICRTPIRQGWQTRAMKPRNRALVAWRASFCHGRTTANESELYTDMTLAGFAKRHPDDVEGDDGQQHIFDWALDSDSPADAELAGDTVIFPVMGAWNVGRDETAGTPYAEKLPRYQQVALQGLICGDVGGCDGQGLNTWGFCLTNEACTPGASLDEIWSDEFAPAEREIISRIQQRIVDERSRRAEARASAR